MNGLLLSTSQIALLLLSLAIMASSHKLRCLPRLIGCLSVVFAIYLLDGIAPALFIPLLLLSAIFYQARNTNISLTFRTLLNIIMMLVSCALIIHIVPGFNNFEILDSVTLSENSVTYSLYLNYDKLLAALYLSLLLPSIPSIRHTIKDNPNKFYASLLMTFFTLSTVVFLLALKLSIIDFAPKIPTFWIEWILINLIITCFAEELLFRGFIQQKIKHTLFQTHKFQAQSSVIAIAISSLLFGLAHIPAGAAYAILACALSLFYGYAFNKTQNILLPVLLHFTFNLLHFLFFSYPYLAH